MLGSVILFLAIALFIFLIIKLIKRVFHIALNSVIGIFAFLGFNLLFGAAIKISFLSVLITAIGGVLGFGLVLTLHYLGVAF